MINSDDRELSPADDADALEEQRRQQRVDALNETLREIAYTRGIE